MSFIELVGIECALGHVTGSIFTNLLPLLIRHIGFIYIVQSELSSNFSTNYPVIKNYLLSFFVKTSSCQFQKKKRFCFSNEKSSSEFSCPYKPAILWRHFLLTRDRRSPHSIPTNSMVSFNRSRSATNENAHRSHVIV